MDQSKRAGKAMAVRVVLLLLISVLFLLCFSLTTSPLVPGYYGDDSAFFTMVGQGITKGMMPYRDFFDMKGPYMFLMEAMGQRLHYGPYGALIVQSLNLFLCLLFADMSFRLVLPKKKLWLELLLLMPVLYVLSVTMQYGNMTEELSLAVLMLCLYCCLRYFKAVEQNGNVQHKWYLGLLYGAAFGFLIFVRITNAAIIGAIIVTISILLISKRQFSNLAANTIAFIAGTVLALLPAIAWCAVHGILHDMLYQVFDFGFSYSEEVGLAESFLRVFSKGLWIYLLPACIPYAVLAVYRVKDAKYWLLSVNAMVFLLAAIVLGLVLQHYFVLVLPNVVLGVWLLLDQRTKHPAAKAGRLVSAGLAAVLLLSIAVPVLNNVKHSADMIKWYLIGGTRNESAIEIAERIPASERDNVLFYGETSGSTWYMTTGIFPCSKYCDWQEHYAQLSPEIEADLVADLQSGEIKWLVVKKGFQSSFSDIQSAIDAVYQVEFENNDYVLMYSA